MYTPGQEGKDKDSVALYTGAVLNDVPVPFFLESFLQKKDVKNSLWNLFQGASGDVPLDFLRSTSDPQEADFLLLPHDYNFLEKTGNLQLVSEFVTLAKTHGKKILVFAMGDSDGHIDVPHSFVIRYSQYKYKKRENEIIAPPYLPIFKTSGLEEYRRKTWENLILRHKREKPTVSFYGWADFPSLYRKCTYACRVLFSDLKKHLFFDKHADLHKPGIYFRRKAIETLAKSSLLKTDFFMRKSFFSKGGRDGRDVINAKDVEQSYVQSILESDFVLAPKGMGNTSTRFFEALSLGRMPVLVDTDYVFPLAKHIDYSKFVLSVDHSRMKDLESTIVNFYNSLSDEEYKKRQKMARDAFLSLRPGAFLKTVLFELKEGQLK